MDKKRIYYMSLSAEKINKFTALGPHLDFVEDVLKDENNDPLSITNGTEHSEVLQRNISKAMEVASLVRDDRDEAEKKAGGDTNPVAAALAATNPLYQELAFFYVSDLIDIVLENIQNDFTAVIESSKIQITSPSIYRASRTEKKKARSNEISKEF